MNNFDFDQGMYDETAAYSDYAMQPMAADEESAVFMGPRPPFWGPRPPLWGPRPPFWGPFFPPFWGPRPPFWGPRPPRPRPRQY